jgi:hypothetical protein
VEKTKKKMIWGSCPFCGRERAVVDGVINLTLGEKEIMYVFTCTNLGCPILRFSIPAGEAEHFA